MRPIDRGDAPLSPSPARIRSTIANAVLQPDELRELRLVHKALADVNRLRIIRRLAAGAASVTELVAEVGLSQPLVSWHVGRLRTAGLVATRRIGRETVCSVKQEAFEAFAARQQTVLGLGDAEGTDPARSAAS
jgi:ArsR family transcriptional regulator, arsenate/arsenite/antimonite-responsive transcriptional repressor